MNKYNVSALILAVSLNVNAGEYTKHVDPFIGTGAIEGGLSGNNYPGATMPYGMVQLSPDTHPAPDWFNASGYNYNDSIIYGFSHTRLSGTGASDLIDILLFPSTGNATSSKFNHARESASPGYYSVFLEDEGILAELTVTPRTGIHRYTFPKGSTGNLLVDLDHSAQKGSWDRKIIQSQIRKVAPDAIAGFRIITGWAKLRKVYFYMKFSRPIADMRFYDGDRELRETDVINGKALRAWLSFDVDSPLSVNVGISPVSIENAAENLDYETSGKDFDKLAAEADAAWEKELGRIDAKADPETLKTFYTALYHTMIQPHLIRDVNGQYMAPDYSIRKVPAAGSAEYSTFSLWDTYRAAHPLYSLIMPSKNADFVNSMLDHYNTYGYLPIWQLWGQDNYCMIGNHAVPVVADAVMKGADGIDPKRAWNAVKGSVTKSHPGSPFDVWNRYGYMPEEIQSQSVSITLEDSFDDWCVAQVAKFLGKENEHEFFAKRAGNYKNLFREDIGFFAPKDSLGNWIEPFDPLRFGANGGYPFTEGNAWQYLWYVPHDTQSLVALLGGKKAFENKLDTFFTLTDTSGEKNDNISGSIGQYAHGNEPSHHVAYLYNDAGNPAKAQRMIHRICKELYNNTSSGYAGNDDCGEMSAWYIFSAMGFYPVNPASGEYYIGTPLLDECVIHLENGKDFVITADRSKPDDIIVKDVRINGKKPGDLKLRHKEIMEGGVMKFRLQGK